MKERIQKVLASAGVASRRAIEEMVLQGRVAVNGRVVSSLPVMIDPNVDKIRIDDEPVHLREAKQETRYYILMNKPPGVYTTNVAQGEQTRAIDLLPRNFPARVYPVGQMDAESRGLLLLTNDGELTNRLTHPRYGVPKTYRATVDGFISHHAIQEIEKGMWLADRSGKAFKTGRARLKVLRHIQGKSILEISMREGKNRQVRRVLAKVGHKVRELTRVKFGPLELKGLAAGQIRPLTPREVKELWKSTEPKSDSPQRRGERREE